MRIYIYLLPFISFTLLAQKEIDTTNVHIPDELILSLDSVATYKQHSIIAHSKGDFDTFKKYCDAILEIAEINDLTNLKAQAIVNLGIYHSNVSQLDLAIKNYLEASKIVETLPKNKKAKITILINLGNLYNKIKEYEKATSAMKEAIVLANTVESSENYLIAAYIALGTIASKKNDYNTSVNYYNKAKDLAVTINNKNSLTTILLNLNDNYFFQEEYDKVITNCKEILANFTEEDSKKQKARALLILGEAYFKKEQSATALPHLQQAVVIAKKSGLLEIEMKAHEQLAKVYETQKNLTLSLQEQKNYTAAREAYLNTLSKAQKIELEEADKEKTEILTEQKEALHFLTTQKQLLLWLGGIIITLLLTLTFFYRKKRKNLLQESSNLKVDKELLLDKNEALQHKLKALASKIKETQSSKNNTASSQKTSLTLQDQEKYMQQILDFMDEEKPYLDHNVKQHDVANKLSMTVHLFSEILNVCFQQNFNSFINLYRVSAAKSLIGNPKYENYKILSIGYEAGFSSKTSFNRVFKNLVGCTPSEYQKKQLSPKEV